MKVKTISRSIASTERECKGDLRREFRNLAPEAHPMQRAREYTRAVTSAKLDRMFAKPFVGSLGTGHRDGVTATATSRQALVPFVSGAADGEIRIWDLASRSSLANLEGAHSKRVTGLTFANDGTTFYSSSIDGTIKSWQVYPSTTTYNDNNDEQMATKHGPCMTYRAPNAGSFQSIDHHRSDNLFVSASDSAVDVWSPERNTPILSFDDLWGSDDTVNHVRYNPAERGLIAHTSADRGLGLFDVRSQSALHKIILAMRANALEWNPMEPMNLAVASEDYNAYTFDIRKLDRPTMIYKGHASAVMALSWSPTGREFATASYDKTIRIYPHRAGKARDIYHLKRMQRVFTVNYSADNNYIISGSDDTNLRLWRAQASQAVGKQKTAREERSLQYRQTLIQKYKHMPDVKRIHTARKVPKFIKSQTALQTLQKESRQRKKENEFCSQNNYTIILTIFTYIMDLENVY